MRIARAVPAAALLLAGLAGAAAADPIRRNLAGSVQLDYLQVATEDVGRQQGFDGATVEVSLKMVVDFNDSISSSVKVCIGCHGVETGMAFLDFHVTDAFNVRVGRLTPQFGEFPLRHDPANHRTSDKPLPYDMGRMLRLREWNMGVLPAPWVDNGIEISGTHFFGQTVQLDYAAYAVSGPRAAAGATDFDYVQSRSPSLYYVDNNSRPVLGGRVSAAVSLGERSLLTVGASGMHGTYDPDNQLDFTLVGADAVLRLGGSFLRAEYLIRRTEMALGADPGTSFRYGPGPDGEYDRFFLKEGFNTELEVPIGFGYGLLRFDGLRRRGNLPVSSRLRGDSAVLRTTVGATYRLQPTIRLKVSAEFYDFSDFEDEVTTHIGLVGSF